MGIPSLIMETQDQSYKSLLNKLKRKGGLNQVSCECCLAEITKSTYIKCSVCPTFFMCVNCYCSGKSKGEHLVSHAYQVIDPLNFPLFTADWAAKEELMLLEGMLKFGYGNWGSISQYMSSNKAAWDCERHYKQIFQGNAPEALKELKVLSHKDESGRIQSEEVSCTADFMNIEEEVLESEEPTVPPEKHPLAEFAGYMPLRQDFEVEYENDIEIYLADLEFYEDDRPEDVCIKLKQLHVYNGVLDEREERKDFAINRWPDEIRNERKYKNNPIHRTIYQSLKPYARFLPADKFARLVEGMIKEYELRLKLDELLEAHNSGVTTEEEFRSYLSNKRANPKSKDLDMILKDSNFLFKEAERVRMSVAAQEMELDPEVPLDDEFCSRLNLDKLEFQAIKDEISKQFELKHNLQAEDIEGDYDPAIKQEIFDFVVNLKSLGN